MIISLPVTLLIYQLVAAFGVLGLTALIVLYAGIDFQLMFLQNSIDKLRNWKRFKNKTSSKLLVILFTVISIVFLFLPTLFTLATEIIADRAYYYTNMDMYSQQDPSANPDPPVLPTTVEDYPPFDDFRVIAWRDGLDRPEYESYSWTAVEGIVKNYLYTHLDLPTEINKNGVWYGVLRNLTSRFDLDRPDHTYYDYNEYQRQHEAPTLQKMDTTTGTYRTDNDTPTYTFGLAGLNSFSLHECDGQLTSNLPDFENHQLLAVSNVSAGVQCYPQFDASLPITVQVGSTVKKSVLDDNDRVYRTARFNTVSDISSAISVSAMYLNDTFLTMAIKKTAHITYHSDSVYLADEKEILNCSSANLEKIYIQDADEEYNRLNHTKILCQLKSLSQQNPSFNMLQATHRSMSANFSVNSVYTYSAPTIENTFGGMAIDLTWFTSYTLQSPVFNFPKGQEFLVAHVFNDRHTKYLNRNLETLIMDTDVFGVSDPQDPVLPNLVKIQAALKAKNTYYFSKSTASVHLAYDIASNSSWVYMVAVPGCFFFLCACLAARQKRNSLRARISACETVEQFDDRDTLVDGRNKKTSTPPLTRSTKLSLCHENATSQANIPMLMLDGKSILLEQ